MTSRRLSALCTGLAAVFVSSCIAPAGAQPAGASVQQIPVDRLIAILEQAVAENSVDVERFINLARAHAAAFSWKSPTLPVEAGKELNGVYFREDGPHLPFASVSVSGDPAVQKRAEAHLAAAVATYEWALRINPFNTIARLGYGWCLQHSGEVQEAVAQYRRVIDEEWPRERNATRTVGAPKGPITVEAAGYLIPLLDAARDGAEIARLRGYADELSKKRE